MKSNIFNIKNLIRVFFISVLSSCAVNDFYQVYTTKVSSNNIVNGEIVFTNDKCVVKYKFNNNGENISFYFNNVSENYITIDLKKSFFILNGNAKSYFQNRSVTGQFSSSLALTENNQYYNNFYNIQRLTGVSTAGISVTYHESPTILIPPKTHVILSEFSLNKVIYNNCGIEKYPSSNKIKKLNFNKENSPFVFTNLVTFYDEKDTQTLNHDFYIEEIANYPQDDLLITRDTNNCGDKLMSQVYTLKKFKANEFFIQYQKR